MNLRKVGGAIYGMAIYVPTVIIMYMVIILPESRAGTIPAVSAAANVCLIH